VIATRLYERHPPRYEYYHEPDKGKALGPVLEVALCMGGSVSGDLSSAITAGFK